jgi:ATP-dependent Zn protease
VADLMIRCREEARHLVQEHRQVVCAIAKTLIVHDLTSDDVQTLANTAKGRAVE